MFTVGHTRRMIGKRVWIMTKPRLLTMMREGATPRRAGTARAARHLALLLAGATALSGCQSILDQAYQPNVAPSENPQIVDEVQKNDPRAQMGAR